MNEFFYCPTWVFWVAASAAVAFGAGIGFVSGYLMGRRRWVR